MVSHWQDQKKKHLNSRKESYTRDISKTLKSQQPPFTCVKSAFKKQAFKTIIAAEVGNLSSLRAKENQW